MSAVLSSATELFRSRQRRHILFIDCRFDLSDGEAGLRAFHQSHIAGAVYAHLDDDLAAPVTAASGRHPLPSPEQFATFLARCGWRPERPVVVYDDAGGAIAARLWWLMRYFGLGPVTLLDGGFPAWQAAGGEVVDGPAAACAEPLAPAAVQRQFRAASDMTVSVHELQAGLASGRWLLLDARAAARFRGENEPIDTLAGHVPGALNRPFDSNLQADGQFHPAGRLRDEFTALLASTEPATEPSQVVQMCGSGVTACHNLVAMEQAGLGGSRLYVGSWSQWIRDPARPVATG